jgi:hypothetical protein
MGLFGKMVEKTPVPEPIDPEKPLTSAGRRRLLNKRRKEEAQEKSEASAFSDAFAWWVNGWEGGRVWRREAGVLNSKERLCRSEASSQFVVIPPEYTPHTSVVRLSLM